MGTATLNCPQFAETGNPFYCQLEFEGADSAKGIISREGLEDEYFQWPCEFEKILFIACQRLIIKHGRTIAGVIDRTIGDVTDFSSGAPCLTSKVVRVGDAFNSRGSIFEVFINVLQPTAIDVLVSCVKSRSLFNIF